MNRPQLTMPAIANAAVAKYRILKFVAAGTVEKLVVQGAAAADLLVGVSTDIPAESGEPCDVVVAGPTTVEYGGAVARGQKLTSDADGKAIAAAPAGGANANIIGIALVSGVSGDFGSVLISPSVMQG